MIETLDQFKSELLAIKDKFNWTLINKGKIRASNTECMLCPLTALRFAKDGKVFLTMDTDLAVDSMVERMVQYPVMSAADNIDMNSKERKELREWMEKNLLS